MDLVALEVVLMASTKITLDPSFRATGGTMSVSCEAKPLTFNLDPSALGKLPAESIARRIQEQIRGLSPAWNKTGTLVNGIRAVQNGEDWDIVGPPGRLQEPKLLERFREKVYILSQPLVDPIVKATVGKTAEQIVDKSRS